MTEPAPLEKITEAHFRAYERVRSSGKFNMHFPEARRASGLTEAIYVGIIEHYEELMEKHPAVRREEKDD